MNINQLESFSLAESAKFKDHLNPTLWDRHENLRNAVKDQILVGAEEYCSYLGLSEEQVVDIIVTGSNAGYLYESNSGIDVVVIAELNQDETFREFFNEHKYKYNGQHRVEVSGHLVQFYVQPAEQSLVTSGSYSLLRESWVQIPVRRTLKEDTVKQLRALDLAGRPKAPKVVKKKIVKERKPTVYGFGRDYLAEVGLTPDGVSASTCQFANEQDDQQISDEDILKDFIKFCSTELKLNALPAIKLRRDPQWPVVNKTFGRYNDAAKTLEVSWGQRHIMDVFRTVAHELTHAHQHERETVPASAGETGSDYENEANARAGILMREYAQLHPEFFSQGLAESNKLFCRKLKSKDELIEYAQHLSKSLSVDRPITHLNRYTVICSTLFALDKYKLNESSTPKFISSIKEFMKVLHDFDEFNKLKIKVGTKVAIINYQPQGESVELWGFTTPKTITKIYKESTDNSIRQFEFNNDPEDIWPRTEQAEYNGNFVSNSAFFGSKDSAEKALEWAKLSKKNNFTITDHIKESLQESSGYIPTAAEAHDPRFEMALSVDVRPGALGKAANALDLNTDSQGHPQLLRADGVVERMFEEYKRFKK